MTTLKDLLNDFAEDIKKQIELKRFDEDTFYTWDDAKGTVIDEYIETIKNRIVG